MVIGICDDEQIIRDNITQIVDYWCKTMGIDYQIYLFSDGEQVINSQIRMDLLFLDIEMNRSDGISTMHKLASSDAVWRIVFVSSHDELIMNIFGVKTLAFVRKPFNQQDIIKWLSVVQQELGSDFIIELEEKDAPLLRASDVVYIESCGNYTNVATREQTYMTRRTMQKWEGVLKNGDFLRIHKSYIVNMDYIAQIGNDLELKNGMTLTIGRSYKKSSLEDYNNYVLKKMRNRR